MVPQSKYVETINYIMVSVVKSGRLCYVTLNKPYAIMEKEFKEFQIDTKDVEFIDCVSGSAADKQGKAVFVSSPRALTELSITISGMLAKNINSMLFDSLSTLLIYHEQGMAIKFVHSMISKVRATEKKCVFLLLEEDAKSEMMKDVTMFADKVVYL